jgi:hypothetical protein
MSFCNSQSTLLSRLLKTFVFLFLVGSTAYGDSLESTWLGKPVFNRVGLRGEWKGDLFLSYSTNYVGVSEFFPVNTAFVVKSIDSKKIVLQMPEKKRDLVIEYIEKHNRMTTNEYMIQTFSSKREEMPASLTKTELAQITRGEYAVGMSRAALFLSIGYPPASLNGDLKGSTLTYQKKRFNKVTFQFEGNTVAKILD